MSGYIRHGSVQIDHKTVWKLTGNQILTEIRMPSVSGENGIHGDCEQTSIRDIGWNANRAQILCSNVYASAHSSSVCDNSYQWYMWLHLLFDTCNWSHDETEERRLVVRLRYDIITRHCIQSSVDFDLFTLHNEIAADIWKLIYFYDFECKYLHQERALASLAIWW